MRTSPAKKAVEPELADAAKAFDEDWKARDTLLANSPVMALLEAHDDAGTPHEQVIMGVRGITVTLGDLRKFIKALR